MNPLQISLMTIFHPVDGFCVVKSDREHFSYVPTIIMSVLLLVVRVLSLFLMHYSVATQDPANINIEIEVAMIVLPALSWIIVHYAVTTISSGECKMREVYAGLLYACVPYIICTIPIALLSHLYSKETAGTINLLNTLVVVYCAFQIIVSIKAMNDYSMKKTIGIILISLIGIVLCWVLILLLYGLTGQLINTGLKILIEFINIYIS